jgi:hypothetical protein
MRAFRKSMLSRVSLRKGVLSRLVELVAIQDGVEDDDMAVAATHGRGGGSRSFRVLRQRWWWMSWV